jgi:hypothetical protein
VAEGGTAVTGQKATRESVKGSVREDRSEDKNITHLCKAPSGIIIVRRVEAIVRRSRGLRRKWSWTIKAVLTPVCCPISSLNLLGAG